MPKIADIGSKRLISLAPDQWVRWVTGLPIATTKEILDAQFQWVSRESDVLVKAHIPELGNFLVLNELQLRYTEEMPLRMTAYAALAREKYKLPVYPVLVNILPPASTITIEDRFEDNFLGLKAEQDYRVINLWEIDVELVFNQSLNSLLPFVPVLKGGGEEPVIRRALQTLREDEQLRELETLLAFFSGFMLDTELVVQIMRWDMTVLRESPWYQEILQEGEERGEKRGEERGRLEEARSLVLRLLLRAVGEVTPSQELRIQELSQAQLESLGEALFDFSNSADLDNWLSSAE